MQNRITSTSIWTFVAALTLAACGGRPAEAIFDTSPDASADATGSTTGGGGASIGSSGPATSTVTGIDTTTGAGGAIMTSGSGGMGGQVGGSGGSGPNPACNPSNCKGCCDAQRQ